MGRIKPATSSSYSRHLNRQIAAAETWTENLVVGGKPQGQLRTPLSRLPLLAILLVVVGITVVLLAQLFNLQVVNGVRYAGLANGNRLREQVTYAPRGRILDRNGVMLATNTASFQLVAYPYLLPRDSSVRQSSYQTIATELNLNVSKVQTAVETNGLDDVQPVLVLDHLAYQTALVIEQKLPELPGFSLDGVPQRVYKSGSGLANILGYVGRADAQDLKQRPVLSPVDFVGRDGVEAQYDQLLRGTNGVIETEVDALGRPVRTIREQAVIPGKDIKLTIDYGLQKVFAAAVARQMKIAHVKRAAGVALDPNTGAVLAMVNLPSYNDNLFAAGISDQAYQALLNDPNQPLFNKVIAGEYPSGSIIKPMELTGALQEGVVTPNTVIVDRGKIVVPSVYNPQVTYTFNGWVPGGLGPMNAVRAIAMSSDIYFYTVGGGYQGFQGMGVDRLDKYYKDYGLGQLTGIDLPGEQTGLVPSPAWKKQTFGQDWVLGDTYHLAIGQGDLLVTPLQMAVATATIANGGKLIQPHIFAQTADGADQAKVHVVRSDFVKPQWLALAREGMREVIGGTTSPAVFAGVPVTVAGKSGTAEVGYVNKEVPHAWYEAFAPFNHPEITFALVLEHGEGGSAFAAPAIASAMAWYFTNRN